MSRNDHPDAVVACEQYARDTTYMLAAEQAVSLYGSSPVLDRAMQYMGLPAATALSSTLSVSNEGAVSWVLDRFKGLLHHVNIFVNKVYSKITLASVEVDKAIAEAQRQGPDHDVKLPISKTGMVLGTAAIVAATIGLRQLATSLKSGKVEQKSTEQLVVKVKEAAAEPNTDQLLKEEADRYAKRREHDEAQKKSKSADFKKRWREASPEERERMARESGNRAETTVTQAQVVSAATKTKKAIHDYHEAVKEVDEAVKHLGQTSGTNEAGKEQLRQASEAVAAAANITRTGDSGLATVSRNSKKRTKRRTVDMADLKKEMGH